jgi:2-oxoglutarate dehydrogenase complex dehydrogenase (E1) component-like enzyme
MEQSKRNCNVAATDTRGEEQSTHQTYERYLQLCARHNMYVADCTTPANFFTC